MTMHGNFNKKVEKFNPNPRREKCCNISTPKQVKKNALNRIFEIKRWETHALFDFILALRLNDWYSIKNASNISKKNIYNFFPW